MFRISLFALFFVAANADIFGIERQLQDFDLDSFQFNFAGININAELAQEKCPNQWSEVISSVIQGCPNFMDVCPQLEVPEEFTGTVAPADAPTAQGIADTIGDVVDGITDAAGNATDIIGGAIDAVGDAIDSAGNGTLIDDMSNTAPPPTDGELSDAEAALSAGVVPSCEEISEAFCDAFGTEDLTECCLLDSTKQITDLVVCIVKETTGEDRSNCEVPVCPTGAPGATGGSTGSGSSPGPTDAPAPAPSAAASLVSRMVVLAASAIAFFML